jgi:hypothetical protein
MPNLDKTGPRGTGANTGRGLGQCNPASSSSRAVGGRRSGCRGRRGLGLGLSQQSISSKSSVNTKKK